eukprot:3212752-Prymnesium_polylepis.1
MKGGHPPKSEIFWGNYLTQPRSLASGANFLNDFGESSPPPKTRRKPRWRLMEGRKSWRSKTRVHRWKGTDGGVEN